MKKKKELSKKAAPPPARPITIMEVQEKLGLFAPQPDEKQPPDTQEILKKKPLGYI